MINYKMNREGSENTAVDQAYQAEGMSSGRPSDEKLNDFSMASIKSSVDPLQFDSHPHITHDIEEQFLNPEDQKQPSIKPFKASSRIHPEDKIRGWEYVRENFHRVLSMSEK